MGSLKKREYVIFHPNHYKQISQIQPTTDLTRIYQIVQSLSTHNIVAIVTATSNNDTWHQDYFIRVSDVSKLEKAIHGIKG